MTEKTAPRARRGRRPGPGSTRQLVLDAARTRFAADGYTGTTIRLIAADAGVDASQVMQFFRTKDDLFAAVMEVPASALERFDTAFEGPSNGLGERVVGAYLEAWEGPAAESDPLMAMLRGAIVNEQASEQLSGFIQSRLTLHGGTPNADEAALRAGLAAAMLVGIVTSRRIIGVPMIVGTDADEIVRLVGPAIQRILVPESPAATGRTEGPRP